MRDALQRCAQTLLGMVNNLQHASNTDRTSRDLPSTGSAASEFSRLFRSPTRINPSASPINGNHLAIASTSNSTSTYRTTTIAAPVQISQSLPASTSVISSTLPFHVTPGLSITPRRFNSSYRRRGTPASRHNSPRARNGLLTMVCLASKTDATAPDTETKVNLLLAGLGEKRISFSLTESPRQFSEVVYQNYEKLRNGGAFELLRSERNCRELIPIPIPVGGYHGQFVKTVFGQAKAFIRPTLRNLLDDEHSSVASNNLNGGGEFDEMVCFCKLFC